MNEIRLSGILIATNDLGDGSYGVLIKTMNGSRVDFVWESEDVAQWKAKEPVYLEGELFSVPVEVDSQKMYVLELRPSLVVVGQDDSVLDTLKTEDPLLETVADRGRASTVQVKAASRVQGARLDETIRVED